MGSSRGLAAIAAMVTCVACDAGGAGPGGLRIRDGVSVVHEFPPVSVACVTESACPQYIVPEIVDVAHRGSDWVILYHQRFWIDPGNDQWDVRAGYFVSRDDGATWQRPELTGAGGYGPRISSMTLASGEAFPTALLVSGGQIYQVVPAEMELGTGRYTWMGIYRIDLDANAVVSTGTVRDNWVHEDQDALSIYDFFGANPGYPTTWYRFDPATDPSAGVLGQALEEYVAPPMRGSCAPPIWRRTGIAAGARPVLGGHCVRQYLPSSPAEHCWFTASPPDVLQPDWACVPESDWPVPPESAPQATTLAIPTYVNGFAGVMWTEGSGTAAITRAVRIASSATETSPVTYEIGPGEPLYGRNDQQVASRAFGGVDHSRWADFQALSQETDDGGRRTTLYRFTGSGFAATTLPTRPCADGVDCGYRPTTINDGSYLPSVLQWVTSLGGDRYRMFYVVDVATSSESRLVVLTSVETLDRGPAAEGGELERACVLEQACLEGSLDVEQCVRSWLVAAEASDAALQRFVAARTCAELEAADPGPFGYYQSCSFGGLECRGDVAYSCAGGTLGAVVDCSRTDGDCSINAGGDAVCAPAGVDCATQAGSCDGSGRAIRCATQGVQDCPAAGLECLVMGSGAQCGRRIAACTTPGESLCDGDFVMSCQDPGLAMGRQDCSRIPGFSCAIVGGYADCTDGSGACDVLTPDRCEGSRLVYCLAGAQRSIDCAALGMTCGTDGASRTRCMSSAVRPDGGMPIDAGAPACGSASLGGPTVSEVERPDYPTPAGGTIADGTYHLTAYEVWSASVQPFTHQETLVVSGTDLTTISLDSTIGLSSTVGTFTTMDANLAYTTSCPSTATLNWRYSVTPTGLVILDSSRILTFTRE